MLYPKSALFAAATVVSLYGLAWGYGSAFQDAPPAESPAYGRGYKGQEGKNKGVGMEKYSSSAKEKRKSGSTRSMGGPPSAGSMGGSSSGGE